MKYGIDCGHNCTPVDTGAVAIAVEDKLTKAVGTHLMAMLAAKGHEVVDCTPLKATSLTDSLNRRVRKANESGVDLYVSIHFNAYQDSDEPMGTEVFALSAKAKSVASKVLAGLISLGFKDRGVKSAPLYVIKNTYMPAILIEVCFIDSKADMEIYQKVGAKTIAGKICEGLTW